MGKVEEEEEEDDEEEVSRFSSDELKLRLKLLKRELGVKLQEVENLKKQISDVENALKKDENRNCNVM